MLEIGHMAEDKGRESCMARRYSVKGNGNQIYLMELDKWSDMENGYIKESS